MNVPLPDAQMNPWLIGIAGHYYPYPEFKADPDEYVHVLSRRTADDQPIVDGVAVEQRPAELRLSAEDQWLNPDRSLWRDGDREVFAWMPHGGDRVIFYRQKFDGSYIEILQRRLQERIRRTT